MSTEYTVCKKSNRDNTIYFFSNGHGLVPHWTNVFKKGITDTPTFATKNGAKNFLHKLKGTLYKGEKLFIVKIIDGEPV